LKKEGGGKVDPGADLSEDDRTVGTRDPGEVPGTAVDRFVGEQREADSFPGV
jgi:hypothetical protein